MWPIYTRVNGPENDDPSILERTAEPLDWQAPMASEDRTQGTPNVHAISVAYAKKYGQRLLRR